MIGPTQKLAEFIAKINYRDLPQEVIQTAKKVFIDSIGSALGGYAVDKNKIVIELSGESGGHHQASVIGGGRTSYAEASFINAELINGLDFDCIGPLTGHVIPYCLPSCLAIGEMTHASGKDLILALAVALEVGGRVGHSVLQQRIPKKEPPYYEMSPRFSEGTAVFGGTAGGCKLLGLDSQKVCYALGIAGASLPVPAMIKWQNTPGPSPMVKYNSWPGWCAELATKAALFADRGYTGDTSILDGESGFWKMYGSPFFHEDVAVGGLGKEWHVQDTEFKPYPSCRFNHAGIDGIVQLVQANNINPDNINQIIVRGDSWMLNACRSQDTITSAIDTEFSILYAFAVAAYHGRNPGPVWVIPSTYNDPRITELMKKVKVVLHPRHDELILERIEDNKMPAFWESIVEIDADGKKYSIDIKAPKGVRTNPLSDEELRTKFYTNAEYLPLPKDKIDRIFEMGTNLEEIKDVTTLAAVLRLSD